MIDDKIDKELEKELADVLEVTKRRLPLLIADVKLTELREVLLWLREQEKRVYGKHSTNTRDRHRTLQSPVAKDIHWDVLEAKIRTERAYAQAVRKGQMQGWIGSRKRGNALSEEIIRPGSLFTSQGEMTDLYQLADYGDDADFEAALRDARYEDDNLTRRNVFSRLRQRVEGQTTIKNPRKARADKIAELAKDGLSSRQMAKQLGIRDDTVRQLAREYGVEIPADRSTVRTKAIDPNKIVRETIDTLSALPTGIEYIDWDELDLTQVKEWSEALDATFKALSRFRRRIKELANDDDE